MKRSQVKQLSVKPFVPHDPRSKNWRIRVLQRGQRVNQTSKHARGKTRVATRKWKAARSKALKVQKASRAKNRGAKS